MCSTYDDLKSTFPSVDLRARDNSKEENLKASLAFHDQLHSLQAHTPCSMARVMQKISKYPFNIRTNERKKACVVESCPSWMQYIASSIRYIESWPTNETIKIPIMLSMNAALYARGLHDCAFSNMQMLLLRLKRHHYATISHNDGLRVRTQCKPK
jgi:hypothetical protein